MSLQCLYKEKRKIMRRVSACQARVFGSMLNAGFVQSDAKAPHSKEQLFETAFLDVT